MDDFSKYSDNCGHYFDKQYSLEESYWGDQPNLLVPLISSHLRPRSRVLVIGCGEGRDALFLARIGFDVVATEISESGLNKVRAAIKSNGVKLELFKLDAHESHNHLGKFDTVLIMNVLQFLHPDKVGDIIVHFQSLVTPGGFMSIQVFTTEDPHYQKQIQKSDISYDNLVVEHPTRGYKIRYFKRGELSSFYRGWELIYYHEGLMWDKPHGVQIDFHQHGMAQMIARKKLSDDII
ncbi:MAG: methyltransferase domain-containing protein [candidate division Zixibacteria bacterium]